MKACSSNTKLNVWSRLHYINQNFKKKRFSWKLLYRKQPSTKKKIGVKIIVHLMLSQPHLWEIRCCLINIALKPYVMFPLYYYLRVFPTLPPGWSYHQQKIIVHWILWTCSCVYFLILWTSSWKSLHPTTPPNTHTKIETVQVNWSVHFKQNMEPLYWHLLQG